MSRSQTSLACSIAVHIALVAVGAATFLNERVMPQFGASDLAGRQRRFYIEVSESHRTQQNHARAPHRGHLNHQLSASHSPLAETATRTEKAGTAAEINSYLDAVRTRIKSFAYYPVSFRKRGITGTVQLDVTIFPDGSTAQTLIHSSGQSDLDKMAVEAVRQAGPFKRPPRGELSLILPIQY